MRTSFVLSVVALLVHLGVGQESRPESAPDCVAKVEALKKDYEDLQKDEEDKLENDPKTKDTDAVDKLLAEFRKSASKIAASLLAIAQAHPKDGCALAAIRQALHVGLDDEQLASALAILDGRVLDESVIDALSGLNGYGAKSIEPLLRKVIAQNPSRRAKGLACFFLAMRTRSTSARERLLERIVDEFADVATRDGDTLGAVAERRLFAMRNLQVGKKAPEIEGRDMDGVALKLSDYRGKVVVLDFWGFW